MKDLDFIKAFSQTLLLISIALLICSIVAFTMAISPYIAGATEEAYWTVFGAYLSGVTGVLLGLLARKLFEAVDD